MRKLKLALDSLVVQTFETTAGSDARGTVYARDSYDTTTGGPYLCDHVCPTLDPTCESCTAAVIYTCTCD